MDSSTLKRPVGTTSSPSQRTPATAGLSGGVAHFGFRLVDPDDIDRAIAEVERAGGRLLRRGEFAPGLPYAYVADPDGYEIEIWFE
jgi:catechol 2,3-dioxygenase-like lactoylglutathione lyase family enzyme